MTTRTGKTAAARAEYCSETRRYTATCPTCGYRTTRTKRDAAEHIMAQHAAYAHETQA